MQLTPSERYHFEVFGYVLIPDVFSGDEIRQLSQKVDQLSCEKDVQAKGSGLKWREESYTHFAPLATYDKLFLEAAANEKLVAIASDLVGGDIRCSEVEAIINRRRDPPPARGRNFTPDGSGFHRGIRPEQNEYQRADRRYFPWIKALVPLRDIGPDDGGTLILKGSHRLSFPSTKEEAVALMNENSSLVEKVEAKCGSAVMISGSVIHSASAIFSDVERQLFIVGYCPSWAQTWLVHEYPQSLVDSLNERMRGFLTGGDRYWSTKGPRV